MTALRSRPVRRILRAIADAATRWADADFPPRVRTLDAIAARTGYSVPTVEYALDRLFESLTHAQLEAAICDELGSLDALDGFVERAGRPRAHALPLGRACVISSRTTIGVAIVPAAFALCAKCDVLVKDREDHLVEAFFKTLAQEDDVFSLAADAQPWEGDDVAFDLQPFAAVVAFGRDETLQQIRSRCAPEARFVGFGGKASAGYVTRAALRDEKTARMLAERAARDLVLYEGEGCLSLHALFVERGGEIDTDRFAALLAAAVERATVEFPPGAYQAQAQARLGSARAMAAFRAASGSGSVFSDERATHLIVADPPRSQPPFFLPRALGVLPVDSPAEASAYLRMHGISLEALATDRSSADIERLAVDAGASRIATFGELQSPLVAANHGGRARVSDFVRWITDET
jgi:acyl-CoA reductase-like NAD-dependent aldehyde dehydrogenase